MSRAVLLCKWHAELVDALLGFGAEVHLLLDRFDTLGRKLPEDVLTRCASVHRVSSFDSLEELSGVVVSLRLADLGVDTVMSHSEISQLGAGYLSVLLGLAEDPLTLVAHRDKRLMKRFVRHHGVATARFVSVPDPTAPGALRMVRDAGLSLPLVVKPASGFGGVSTTKVVSNAELEVTLRTYSLDPLLRSHAVIVEEFVTGDEVAVDAIWSGGRELSLVAHRYHQPRLTHARPSTETMDGSRVLMECDHPRLYEQVREMHEKVNRALGITDCATHMEVFVLPSGEVVFSEIATRAGGAWIPALLSEHLGYPMWRAVTQALIEGRCDLPSPAARPNVGTVSLHPSDPGFVSELPEPAALAQLPGVVSWEYLKKPGDRARLNNPSEYYVHVVVVAASEPELVDRCRTVVDQARVVTVTRLADDETVAARA